MDNSIKYYANSKLVKGLTFEIEVNKQTNKLKFKENLEIFKYKKDFGTQEEDLTCYEKIEADFEQKCQSKMHTKK